MNILRRMTMYKYQITLTDGSLLVATSDYSALFSANQELKEGISLFVNIGNVIVRKVEIQSIVEVNVNE